MAKTQFVCQNCGTASPKWSGQCPQCGSWNTLVEQLVAQPSRRGQLTAVSADLTSLLTNFSQVEPVTGTENRFSSTLAEFDRVLGGGIVPGSVVLIGGEPGIGKSTLMTQMLLGYLTVELAGAGSSIVKPAISAVGRSGSALSFSPKTAAKKNVVSEQKPKSISHDSGEIFYVCGEENPSQISLRINRIINNEQFLSNLNLTANQGLVSAQDLTNLVFVQTTDVDQITALIDQHRPKLVIVDSIQTLSTGELSGASGSIGQLRESTDRLIRVAKQYNLPIFLIGHVTKEGTIAGPKVLEHMVDTVLELSGERTGQFRLLRALKNRFGATDEVGVFQVVEYGLAQVTNPSELLVENQDQLIAGSAISCVLEGTRPLLVEVQALVNSSALAMPRRVGRGIDLSRIQVLAAILEKHARLPLGSHDLFLSAVGGFKITEPAADLGLALAVASSLRNKKITQKTIFIGELGLLGEIRPVTYLERRINEARRLGYEQIISSKTHRRIEKVLADFGLSNKRS